MPVPSRVVSARVRPYKNGFGVLIVADATAAAGDTAYESAITNYEFLAHEVVTTKQIIKRFEEVK